MTILKNYWYTKTISIFHHHKFNFFSKYLNVEYAWEDKLILVQY